MSPKDKDAPARKTLMQMANARCRGVKQYMPFPPFFTWQGHNKYLPDTSLNLIF